MILEYTIQSSLGHTVEDESQHTNFIDLADNFKIIKQALETFERKDIGESEFLYVEVYAEGMTTEEATLFTLYSAYYDFEVR